MSAEARHQAPRKRLAMGFAVALFGLTACSSGENSNRTAVPSPISENATLEEDKRRFFAEQYNGTSATDETIARYNVAADAEDAFIACMESFVPNYRELIRIHDEVYLGADELGQNSPAFEGCEREREESWRLLQIALGDSR